MKPALIKPSGPLVPAHARTCDHVDIASKVCVPDVLVQPHMASLQMTSNAGAGSADAFPASFRDDAFIAEHGSLNHAQCGGDEVIRIPMRNGHATGAYEGFLSGFVLPDGLGLGTACWCDCDEKRFISGGG